METTAARFVLPVPALVWPLGGKHVTVFDIETTGLNVRNGDRIVEIAGIRIECGRLEESKTFSSLINPRREIPIEATRVNGITQKDVAGAGAIEDVLPDFLRFTEGSVLVAHNAEFDCSFLNAEKETCWGYVEIPECFCTRNLSRAVFPQEPRHDLTSVAIKLGIPHGGKERHRALADVILTAKVFLALLERGGIATIEELRIKAKW